jgi:hypothetical protein
MQHWDRTGFYSSFGGAVHGALAGIVGTNPVAAQFQTDGAGRAPKGSCNFTHGELLKMEADQGHVLFGLDLLTVLG